MSDETKVSTPQGIGPRQEMWLKALESGEFKQCSERLTIVQSDGTLAHCCLGVACVVLGVKEKERFKDESLSGSPMCVKYGEDGEIAGLTYESTALLALHSPLGSVDTGNGFDNHTNCKFACTGMNDKLGMSLTEIAARIRAFPHHYFKHEA